METVMMINAPNEITIRCYHFENHTESVIRNKFSKFEAFKIYFNFFFSE